MGSVGVGTASRSGSSSAGAGGPSGRASHHDKSIQEQCPEPELAERVAFAHSGSGWRRVAESPGVVGAGRRARWGLRCAVDNEWGWCGGCEYKRRERGRGRYTDAQVLLEQPSAPVRGGSSVGSGGSVGSGSASTSGSIRRGWGWGRANGQQVAIEVGVGVS
jgi:hypothetical protein